MNKLAKRGLITLALLALLFAVNKTNSLAAGAPGSTRENPEAIDLNTEYEGAITAENEVMWYKTTLSENGSFNVSFDAVPEASPTGLGWVLYVYSGEKALISDKEIGRSSSYTTENWGYPAGTEVYVAVRAKANTNVKYKLKVNYSSTDLWEIENNDSTSTATAISVNKAYHGNFAMNDAYDYFVTTAPSDGYVSFNFGRQNDEGDKYVNNGWYYSVYFDEKIAIDNRYISEENALGGGITTSKYGVKKGQKIYVRVQNDRVGTAVNYKLKVNHVASSSWEGVNNDTQGTAMAISVNKSYLGNFHYSDSYDYYAVTIPSDGYVYFNFGRESSEGPAYVNSGWRYYVYVDGKTLVNDMSVSESRAINSVNTQKYGVKKGQKIYIKVQNDGAKAEVNYKLTVKHTASSAWEKDDNNSKSKACAISVNKSYLGNFDDSDSVDWYTVTAKNTGYVYFNFGRENEDGDAYINSGWKYTIYLNSKVILNRYSVSEHSALEGVNTAKFGVKAGQKLYIRVEDDGAHESVNYKLTVKNSKSSYWEIEDNDKSTKATNLTLKKKTNGACFRNDDADWFVIKASASGKYTVYVGNNSIDDRGSYTVELYNGSKKIGVYNNVTGVNKKVTTVKLSRGQKLYIRITSDSRDVYAVKVTK